MEYIFFWCLICWSLTPSFWKVSVPSGRNARFWSLDFCWITIFSSSMSKLHSSPFLVLIPEKGLAPSLKEWSKCRHHVNLIYASADAWSNGGRKTSRSPASTLMVSGCLLMRANSKDWRNGESLPPDCDEKKNVLAQMAINASITVIIWISIIHEWWWNDHPWYVYIYTHTYIHIYIYIYIYIYITHTPHKLAMAQRGPVIAK